MPSSFLSRRLWSRLPARRTLSILAPCGLLLAGGCAKSEAPAAGTAPRSGGAVTAALQPVEVTPLARRDLQETLDVVGSLAANESAEVRPEVSGLVRAILFEEGQTVKKGEVLVKIDDAELRAQLEQAEARFRLTELTVARSENLGETRTIPQSELDRARSDFASAKAELSVLRTRLERTEIKAPFDGIVGARTISPGDYVTTATVITTIDDLTRLKVDFQVPERFLAKVETGTKFTVRSRALGLRDLIQGEVYFVSAVIDRDTRSSGVKGYMLNPPPALKPGMFANIELVLDVRKAALTVPEGSILTTTAGPQIIVVREKDGGKVVEFIPVTLGLRAKGLVEITPSKGELPEALPVVASGVGGLALFPGARVETRPLRQEFRLGE